MTSDTSLRSISPLRARMIEDMTVRGFNEHTRRDYVRHVRSFAAFMGRSPDTATAEELRLFQLHQTRIGMQPPVRPRWGSRQRRTPRTAAMLAGFSGKKYLAPHQRCRTDVEDDRPDLAGKRPRRSPAISLK